MMYDMTKQELVRQWVPEDHRLRVAERKAWSAYIALADHPPGNDEPGDIKSKHARDVERIICDWRLIVAELVAMAEQADATLMTFEQAKWHGE